MELIFIVILAVWLYKVQGRAKHAEESARLLGDKLGTLERRLFDLEMRPREPAATVAAALAGGRPEATAAEVPETSPVAQDAAPAGQAAPEVASFAPEMAEALEQLSRRDAGPAEEPAPMGEPAPTAPPAAASAPTEGFGLRVPPEPPRPARPDVLTTIRDAAKSWLFGGNLVVRVGIIVLFFGGAFLLKYASDNSLLPIELRLAATALTATVLLALGWRLAPKRRGYGLTLEGGGVGVLYLTVFAAARLYDLVPPGLAFALLIVVSALAAFLSVRQDAAPLAVFGSVGGFLAPILMSTGGGSHIGLFTYYAILDAGILAIAWFKAWRPLNLVGFGFTFIVGAAWGATQYRPEMLVSVELFLALFVAMFIAIALLYALRRDLAVRGYVDGTLVFGVPIAAAGLQAVLMRDIPFGLAYSAASFAAVYLLLAAALRRRPEARVMFEAMLGLGIVFATLAIPFAFSGPTTGAAWALEGAALVGLGLRQGRATQFWFGLVMQLAAAGAVLSPFIVGVVDEAALPILNGHYLARVLVSAAAFFTAVVLQRNGRATFLPPGAAQAAIWPFAWSLLWWFGAGVVEAGDLAIWVSEWDKFALLTRDWSPTGLDVLVGTLLVLFAVSAVLLEALATRLDWALVRQPTLALVPVITLVMLLSVVLPSPLAGWRGAGALVAIVVAYTLLHRQQATVANRILAPLHTLAFLALSVFIGLELLHRLNAVLPGGAWRLAAEGALPALLLLVMTRAGQRIRWPVGRFPLAYQGWAMAPFATLLVVWGAASLFHDGSGGPLMWLPILNPLDLALGLAALGLMSFHRRLPVVGLKVDVAVLVVGSFVAVAAVYGAFWLRVLHHAIGAPYRLPTALLSFDHQLVTVVLWCAFVAAALHLVRQVTPARLVTLGGGVLLALLWLWVVGATLTADGGRWTVLPLANPFDLVQALVWATTAFWLVRASRNGLPVRAFAPSLRIVALALAFLWLNAMLLRGLHHWAGLPYTLHDLMRSTVVQAALSLFWTVCALVVMLGASMKHVRAAWFVGAGLLGVTVVKLFLFDLSRLDGVTRIAAFIGIGLLLLLIGYFSPLPPRLSTEDGATKEDSAS